MSVTQSLRRASAALFAIGKCIGSSGFLSTLRQPEDISYGVIVENEVWKDQGVGSPMIRIISKATLKSIIIDCRKMDSKEEEK